MRSTSPRSPPGLSTVPFEHGLHIEDVAARAARGAQYPAETEPKSRAAYDIAPRAWRKATFCINDLTQV